MQQLSEIDKAYKKQDDDYIDGLIEQLNKTEEERIKDAIAMFGVDEYEKMTGTKIPQSIKQLEEPPEKDSCPLATQDVKTNLANRKKAIDVAQYGPQNPNEPNEDYWKAKAKEFGGDVASAKKMLCGNCSAFNVKKKIIDCIKKGIGEDAGEVVEAGHLGYCEIFDFKCASKRTCSAWIVGGPLTDDSKELARTISQTPAPKKDRIKGSDKNPEGTASTRSESGGIEVSEQVEETLRNKIADFKKRHPNRNAPSLGTLKKVFRRGAGAFSTSYRPTISGGAPNSRNAWAIARVNKFLKMAGGGEVKKSYREADGDLLGAIFEDGDLLELDCGTGSGGFKAGNTCSKGGDGSKTTKDAPAKGVEEKKGALRRIAEGAKMKAQYGASKAGEIRDYLQSPAGRALMEKVSSGLKIVYKGGIEAVAKTHGHRYRILIGSLISPAFGIELIGISALHGFVNGAIREWQAQNGRSSSKGIARFQAMGSVVTLARTPSDSEIADYITDEILVAIKEAVTNQKDFCITTSFEYDPLQNRDESGKWTGGGDSGRGRGEGKSGVGEGYTSIKQEAEWVYSKILDNPNLEMDRPENQREAKQWSEAVAKDGLGADTSVELQNKSDEMINAVADYTGSGSILMNSESRSEPEKDPNSPDVTIGDKKELLDKAIKIFPNNEQSTIYRGMTEDQAKHAKNKTQSQTRELASTLQVGSEFVDKGFVSTSRDAYVGAKFASLSQLYTNLIGIDEYGDGNPLKEISTYNKNGQFGKMDAKAVKSAFGKSNVYKDTSFFESDLFKDMAKNGNGFLVNPLVGDTKSRLYLTINKAKGKGMAVPRFMNAGSMSKEQEVILPRKSRFRVTEITRVPLYQSNLTGTKKPEIVGNLVSAKVELL